MPPQTADAAASCLIFAALAFSDCRFGCPLKQFFFETFVLKQIFETFFFKLFSETFFLKQICFRSYPHAERFRFGGPCGGMYDSRVLGLDPALPHG